MEFKTQLMNYVELVNKKLNEYFPMIDTTNKNLFDAMAYSINAGGKRLRPVLMLAAYNLFREDTETPLPYCCGIEMIHTYSLIHDDLPAMDNDDYRRGKPTNHKVFGEGLAILAGDGLLNYAFEIMLKDALTHKDTRPFTQAIYEISTAAGVNGMIGGQVVDIESENTLIDGSTLDYIHLNKTAAMITASLKAGAIMAEAKETDIKNMEVIGRSLGLAFQIKDDILDIIGDKGKLGKDIGSDMDNNKSTYPSLYGLEYSQSRVRELTEEIEIILNSYGNKSGFLRDLGIYLMEREC
ncbi:polyprenyl synthetase family protein [Alkaliphilus serpentinus]|uniref:Farnesyl diphosphate synthase n=1 Tax=Alkaliphilus serpentinus TaxID=1482731 RepID=A0A833M8W4_9FIRM|nr:farnesyl diphosphate synthase [Alkaliphilus serpentinus]KAB3527566.1 polyprenyl synthetase family protein [Alkaliphilus serpentinus]